MRGKRGFSSHVVHPILEDGAKGKIPTLRLRGLWLNLRTRLLRAFSRACLVQLARGKELSVVLQGQVKERLRCVKAGRISDSTSWLLTFGGTDLSLQGQELAVGSDSRLLEQLCMFLSEIACHRLRGCVRGLTTLNKKMHFAACILLSNCLAHIIAHSSALAFRVSPRRLNPV